jgi:hypothetical protein
MSEACRTELPPGAPNRLVEASGQLTPNYNGSRYAVIGHLNVVPDFFLNLTANTFSNNISIEVYADQLQSATQELVLELQTLQANALALVAGIPDIPDELVGESTGCILFMAANNANSFPANTSSGDPYLEICPDGSIQLQSGDNGSNKKICLKLIDTCNTMFCVEPQHIYGEIICTNTTVTNTHFDIEETTIKSKIQTSTSNTYFDIESTAITSKLQTSSGNTQMIIQNQSIQLLGPSTGNVVISTANTTIDGVDIKDLLARVESLEAAVANTP